MVGLQEIPNEPIDVSQARRGRRDRFGIPLPQEVWAERFPEGLGVVINTSHQCPCRQVLLPQLVDEAQPDPLHLIRRSHPQKPSALDQT